MYIRFFRAFVLDWPVMGNDLFDEFGENIVIELDVSLCFDLEGQIQEFLDLFAAFGGDKLDGRPSGVRKMGIDELSIGFGISFGDFVPFVGHDDETALVIGNRLSDLGFLLGYFFGDIDDEQGDIGIMQGRKGFADREAFEAFFFAGTFDAF